MIYCLFLLFYLLLTHTHLRSLFHNIFSVLHKYSYERRFILDFHYSNLTWTRSNIYRLMAVNVCNKITAATECDVRIGCKTGNGQCTAACTRTIYSIYVIHLSHSTAYMRSQSFTLHAQFPRIYCVNTQPKHNIIVCMCSQITILDFAALINVHHISHGCYFFFLIVKQHHFSHSSSLGISAVDYFFFLINIIHRLQQFCRVSVICDAFFFILFWKLSIFNV